MSGQKPSLSAAGRKCLDLGGVWTAHPRTLGPSVAEGDHTRPLPQAITAPHRVEGPQPHRGPGPPVGTTTTIAVQGWEGLATSPALPGPLTLATTSRS